MAPEPDKPDHAGPERAEPPAPPRAAWPIGAPAEGMPKWLAWIVLAVLLGAAVASVWLILEEPAAEADPAAFSLPAPAP